MDTLTQLSKNEMQIEDLLTVYYLTLLNDLDNTTTVDITDCIVDLDNTTTVDITDCIVEINLLPS